MFYKLLSFIGVLFFSMPLSAQNDKAIDKTIQSSRDSLNTNPEYAYNSLSSIIKDTKITSSFKRNAYIYLSEYFNRKGVTDSAIFYANKGLIKVTSEKEKAIAYRIIGSSYVQNGKRDEALVWLFKSLEIAERLKIGKLLMSIKSDLGHLYYQKEDYDKALSYWKESANSKFSEEIKLKALINIASVYFRKADYETAKSYLKKALDTPNKDKYFGMLLPIYINLGALDFQEENYDQAEYYFRKARTISKKHNQVAGLLPSTINIGLIHNAKENYNLALKFFDEALQIAEENSNLESQKNIFKYYEETYIKMEDYKSAHEILNKHNIIKDSINKNQLDKRITELEVKYETSQKEEEIKNQTFLKKIFFVGAIIILIPIAFLMILYYQKHKTQVSINEYQKQINKQKVDVLIKEQELTLIENAVKTQKKEQERIGMELHDTIGGNLAFVKLKLSSLDKNNDYESLLKMLEETCDQIRDLSHDLIEEKIEKDSFTSTIINYVNEANVISGKKILFYPHPEEALNLIDDTIQIELFKIIQELLSNAIKHSKASEINIYINKYDESLKLIFEDNGVGFEADKKTDGIGISNIKNRIELLAGVMHVDSHLKRGAIFTIDIPIVNVQMLQHEI